MENISKFNNNVEIIFASLYSEFPCRVNVSYPGLLGAEFLDTKTYQNGDYTGIYMLNGTEVNLKKEIEELKMALLWLYDTGYLIGDISTGADIAIVTLSPKSLLTLKCKPKSLEASEDDRSLGDLLVSGAKSGGKVIAGKLTDEIISRSMEFAFKLISN